MPTTPSSSALFIVSPAGSLRVVHQFPRASEAIVGESFECRVEAIDGSFTGSVRSAPAGSTSTWSSNTFTPDVPGRYALRVMNGTTPINFEVVAFPAEALSAPQVADANWSKRAPSSFYPVDTRSSFEIRTMLRGIANSEYGPVTDAALAALTSDQPLPVGLDVSRVGRHILGEWK